MKNVTTEGTPKSLTATGQAEKLQRAQRMKRVLFLVLAVAMVLGLPGRGAIFAQAMGEKPKVPEQASEKAKIGLEKMWEKKFDEPVVDVIFDKEEMTVREAKMNGWKSLEGEKDKEKIKISYPKGLVTKKSVKFLDSEGKIKKILELKNNEFPVLSEGNKRLGIFKNYNQIIDKEAKDKVLIYSEEGKLLGEYEVEPLDRIIVSDSGEFVVHGPRPTQHIARVIEFAFYDKNGRLVKKLEEKFGPHRSGIFSSDGNYLFLLVEEPYDTSKGHIVHLLCLDKEYKELWRKTIKTIPYGNSLSRLFFNKKENTIEIRAEQAVEKKKTRKSWVFDITGNEIIKSRGK